MSSHISYCYRTCIYGRTNNNNKKNNMCVITSVYRKVFEPHSLDRETCYTYCHMEDFKSDNTLCIHALYV